MTAVPSLVIRRPNPERFAEDVEAVAALFVETRRAMIPNLKVVHSAEQARTWMREVIFPRRSIRIAQVGDEIVGFAARDGAWLMQLYVKPGWTRRGIGSSLLREMLADAAFVTPVLRLYTFARNEGARRFYERHGFAPVAFGDGSANQEGEPDVRYERSTRD